MFRTAHVLAAVVPLLAVSACGGTGPSERPAASRSPIDELDPNRAPSLQRDDALTVSAPPDARPGAISFSVTVPAALDGSTVELRISGTCSAALRPDGGRRAHRTVSAGFTAVHVTAKPPSGRAACQVVLDALAVGRPETGDGAYVTVGS
jgi:hypothetical protein